MAQFLEERFGGLLDLINRDARQAFLFFENADLQSATRTVGLVINNLIQIAAWKPLARQVTGRKNRHARRSHTGGKMHRPAIMADKELAVLENSRTHAGRARTAQVETRPAPGLSARSGLREFFWTSEEKSRPSRESFRQATREFGPIPDAPVFGLDFCSRAESEDFIPRHERGQ